MLIDFLKTETPTDDLKTTLRVLREFKQLESQQEWADVPFVCWLKLEQLEEYLAHLVNGEELAADTRAELNRIGRAV